MAEQKKKGILKEFKEFASRGNVVDLAIGVILGTAFGKITSSLVNDVFMPLFGWLFGGMDFSNLNIVLQKEMIPNHQKIESVTIGIGSLIATIVNFILIAFSVFLMVKLLNTARSKAEAIRKLEKAAEKEITPREPSNEEKLLIEIRDILKERKDGSGT